MKLDPDIHRAYIELVDARFRRRRRPRITETFNSPSGGGSDLDPPRPGHRARPSTSYGARGWESTPSEQLLSAGLGEPSDGDVRGHPRRLDPRRRRRLAVAKVYLERVDAPLQEASRSSWRCSGVGGSAALAGGSRTSTSTGRRRMRPSHFGVESLRQRGRLEFYEHARQLYGAGRPAVRPASGRGGTGSRRAVHPRRRQTRRQVDEALPQRPPGPDLGSVERVAGSRPRRASEPRAGAMPASLGRNACGFRSRRGRSDTGANPTPADDPNGKPDATPPRRNAAFGPIRPDDREPRSRDAANSRRPIRPGGAEESALLRLVRSAPARRRPRRAGTATTSSPTVALTARADAFVYWTTRADAHRLGHDRAGQPRQTGVDASAELKRPTPRVGTATASPCHVYPASGDLERRDRPGQPRRHRRRSGRRSRRLAAPRR